MLKGFIKIALFAVLAIVVLLFYVWDEGIPLPRNKESIFPNRYLEWSVRDAISKKEGKLTPDDCKNIRELELKNHLYFTDLEGIQYFTDLEYLAVEAGQIKDIFALKELKNLKRLILFANDISDISALSEIETLEIVDLIKNRIKDVSPLLKLKNLQILYIYKNPIHNRELLDPLRGKVEILDGSYNDRRLQVPNGD